MFLNKTYQASSLVLQAIRVSSSRCQGDSLERRGHDWKRVLLKRSLQKYTIHSYENIVYTTYIVYFPLIIVYISLYTIYDIFVFRIHYSSIFLVHCNFTISYFACLQFACLSYTLLERPNNKSLKMFAVSYSTA